MDVRVIHGESETRLAKLDDSVSRLVLCASVLDANQMRRLFVSDESAVVCEALRLSTKGGERDRCRRIYAHFGGS